MLAHLRAIVNDPTGLWDDLNECSFWLCIRFAGLDAGLPSGGQMLQSLVAVFSGVTATMLFFEATNLVKHNHQQLVVEATQAGSPLHLIWSCLFLESDPNLGF